MSITLFCDKMIRTQRMMSRALFRRRTNKYGSPPLMNRFFKAIHEFKNNCSDLFRDFCFVNPVLILGGWSETTCKHQ